ncbi:MAG: pyridoxal phosphate-dependent decarboxylase family protein [Gammaproteobacteria bacterium]
MSESTTGLALNLDTETFRALGEDMLNLAAEWRAHEEDDPVLEATSGAVLAALLDEPPPERGVASDELFAELRKKVLRYSRRNGHPRYFAHVCASPDPVGALADLLASTINQNLTAWRSAPAGTTLERLAIRWLDELVGFDGGGHGLLLGGGSAANLHALGAAVPHALHTHSDKTRADLVLYASSETHVSLAKAARFLGIGHVREIAVDTERRMRVDVLQETLNDDRAADLVPALVAGSAGTANAGTVDPLTEIAAVCREAGVWFHIDGAYGAPAAMTETYTFLREGFAQADSLSLDPHKWLYAPFDMGALLVRDPERLRAAYSATSEYITITETAPFEDHAFWDYGLEMSRRFRALKLWIMFKLHGVNTYRAAIADNIATREYLDARLDAEPELQRLASGLSISCFRYRAPGLEEAALNRINIAIQKKLLATGSIILSPTTLDGRYSLRICIVNFHTRQTDMDWVIEHVLAFGREAANA